MSEKYIVMKSLIRLPFTLRDVKNVNLGNVQKYSPEGTTN